MRIGYARVSTTAQNLDMQIEALNKAGCEKTYYFDWPSATGRNETA